MTPPFWRRIPGRWTSVLRIFARRPEDDVDAELRFHFEERIAELAAEGLSPNAAGARAHDEFGDVEAVRTQLHGIDQSMTRRRRRADWWESLTQDLRYALRGLRRSPGFTAVVVITLGLGIALNTTVFSVVSAMLLRPIPYRDPESLVAIFRTQGRDARDFVPAADLRAYREQSRSFAGIAAYSEGAFTLTTPEAALHLQGAYVTANTFQMLGVHPALGRDFLADEDLPGRDAVVMLSWPLWHSNFLGDSAIIGRTVSINGRSCTVVGVMPPGFEFPEVDRVWVPVAFPTQLTRMRWFVQPVARLAPGVSIASARGEVATIAKQLNTLSASDAYRTWGATVMPFRDRVVSSQAFRTPSLLLMGAVGFVLLIACANVANLQVARAITRTREMALRMALGAGRARLARQLFTESTVLALAGGTAGVVGTLVAVRGVRAMIPVEFPPWLEFRVDPTVLAFAAGVVGLTGVLLGVLPALYGTQVDPQRALKEGGTGSTHGTGRTGVRGALVVAEVSLSLVLLVCAALTVQSFLRVEHGRLGFDPEDVMTATVSFGGPRYDTTANRTMFFDRLIDSLEATPGVQRAALVSALPVLGYGNSLGFEAEGHQMAISEAPVTDVNTVVGNYFATMRIPLLAGRAFTRQETTDSSSHVAIVSRAMARRFWPGESPLGRRVRRAGETPGAWVTVVGVMDDIAQNGLGESGAPRPEIFLAGGPGDVMSLVVRGSRNAGDVAAQVQRTAHALDRDVPVYDMHAMREVIATSASIYIPRFYGALFGAFAFAALVLAAVGMFGVIAFTVRQRTREIGIRIALGATHVGVVRLVLSQAAKLVALGLTLGLAGAMAGARLLGGMLYGVRPTDTATLVIVPLLLGAVALGAAFLPAQHAARVDPMRTLRDE